MKRRQPLEHLGQAAAEVRRLEAILREVSADLAAARAEVEALAARLEQVRARRSSRPWWRLPW